MVRKNSALGLNGVYEWLLVRASATIILFYAFYLFIFILSIDKLTYNIWYNFFTNYITKNFTTLTLIAIIIHSWIGIWQVLTDYVQPLSKLLKWFIIIILMLYLFYGLFIIWGV